MRTSSDRRNSPPADAAVILALSALVAVLTAGPAPAAVAAAQWSQDGYGAANAGYNPVETDIVAGTVRRLRARWSVTAGHGGASCSGQAPPVVAGDRLFLPDQTGVAAYAAGTGRRLWRYRFADPMDTHTPLLAVTGGRLIVGLRDCASQSDPDGRLLALDAATGAQRWSVLRDAPIQAMVVDDGYVAVSGEDAAHSATTVFRVGDGTLVWDRLWVRMATGVSAGGRLLLARTTKPGVEAADIATGAVRWRRAENLSAVAADPAGTRFFATDAGGRLWALSATSGRTVWSRPAAAGPVATDGYRIYVARGNDVWARRADTGALDWSRRLDGPAGRAVLAGGVLYVPAAGRPLTSLVPDTGEYAGFRSTLDAVGHAVVAGGHLYVTDGSTLRMYAR